MPSIFMLHSTTELKIAKNGLYFEVPLAKQIARSKPRDGIKYQNHSKESYKLRQSPDSGKAGQSRAGAVCYVSVIHLIIYIYI